MKVRTLLFLLILCLPFNTLLAADCGVKLTFTTSSKKSKTSKYAPKHILAVWVTDSKGKFVRTLMIYARKREKYLFTWYKLTKKEKNRKADAISGATQKSHKTHTIDWDCRDAYGKPVPDGKYQIRIEFADHNAQGPLTPENYIVFTKGREKQTVTPKDLKKITGIKLEYNPG